jgi:hypothetical protein
MLAIVTRNQLDAVFQHRHHAESQQVDFDDAEISTVLFIPLHHSAPWHRGAFEGDKAMQLILADHHAARVLPEMTR